MNHWCWSLAPPGCGPASELGLLAWEPGLGVCRAQSSLWDAGSAAAGGTPQFLTAQGHRGGKHGVLQWC